MCRLSKKALYAVETVLGIAYRVGVEGKILGKWECFNSLASVKDRIGLAMIGAAEREGWVNEDSILVKPTSGNTGIFFAFIYAAKDYQLILTMSSFAERYLSKVCFEGPD